MPWGYVIAGATALYSGYKSHKNAKKASRQGDAALQFEREQYEQMLERYNTYYKPIEESMSAELGKGAQTEEAADWARGEFTRDYDASLDESRRQQRRYGVDPTSTQAARFEEDVAYNRASGTALAANQARTEEDDRHFARSLSFLGGGIGLQQQVAAGVGGQAGDYYKQANQYSKDASNAAFAAGQSFVGAYQGFKGGGSATGTDRETALQTHRDAGVARNDRATAGIGVSKPAGSQGGGVTTHATSTSQATRLNRRAKRHNVSGEGVTTNRMKKSRYGV